MPRSTSLALCVIAAFGIISVALAQRPRPGPGPPAPNRGPRAECAMSWTQRGGDSSRSSVSCWTGHASWQNRHHHHDLPEFYAWPAGHTVTNVVATDTTRGVAVVQTGNDLQGIEFPSGTVVWQSYNLSGITACLPVGSDSCSEPLGTSTMAERSGVSYGQVDETSGTLYIYDRGAIVAADVSTGALFGSVEFPDPNVPPLLTQSLSGAMVFTTSRDMLILRASVFSPRPGVVTNTWFYGVRGSDVRGGLTASATVWSWAPSTSRSSCKAPVFSADNSEFYTICNCDMLAVGFDMNTTIFAVNTMTGVPRWSLALPQEQSAALSYTDPILTTSVWSPQHEPHIVFMSHQNTTPTLHAIQVSSGAWSLHRHLTGIPHSYGAPVSSIIDHGNHGTDGDLWVMTDGGAAFGVSTATLDVAWMKKFDLLPLGPQTKSYSIYTTVAKSTTTPAYTTVWFNYYTGNASSPLIVVERHGASSTTVAAGLPSVVASIPRGTYSMAQFVMGSSAPTPSKPCPQATGTCAWMHAGMLNANNILQMVSVPLTGEPSVDAPVASMAATVGWTQKVRGPVSGTPVIITNPQNTDQAVLIYVGRSDNIVRCADPTSGTLVWSAQLPLNVHDIFGDYASNMLVIENNRGGVATLRLLTGEILALADLGDAIAQRNGRPPWFQFSSEVVMVHDHTSVPFGSPWSLVFSLFEMGSGPATLLKMHVPGATWASSARAQQPLSLLVWNVTSPYKSGYMTTFGTSVAVAQMHGPVLGTHDVVIVSSQPRAASAQQLSGWNSNTGNLLWRTALPANTYRLQALVVDPAHDAVWALTSGSGTNPQLSRYDVATGQLAFTKQPCHFGYESIGLSPGRKLLVGTCVESPSTSLSHSKAFGMDTEAGDILWWGGTANDYMMTPPTIDSNRGVVLYGTSGGTLTALNASNGESLTDTTLVGAGSPIKWSELNAYPAFTFSRVTVSLSGEGFAAGGSTGHLYQLPSLTGRYHRIPPPPAPPPFHPSRPTRPADSTPAPHMRTTHIDPTHRHTSPDGTPPPQGDPALSFAVRDLIIVGAVAFVVGGAGVGGLMVWRSRRANAHSGMAHTRFDDDAGHL